MLLTVRKSSFDHILRTKSFQSDFEEYLKKKKKLKKLYRPANRRKVWWMYVQLKWRVQAKNERTYFKCSPALNSSGFTAFVGKKKKKIILKPPS